MNFPVELVRDSKNQGLALKVSSLPAFGGEENVVPKKDTIELGLFGVTYERYYTVQQIESELKRHGITHANAYMEVETSRFTTEKPYREMKTTTFQSYHIPEELAENERRHAIALAQSCTS